MSSLTLDNIPARATQRPSQPVSAGVDLIDGTLYYIGAESLNQSWTPGREQQIATTGKGRRERERERQTHRERWSC